VSHVRDAVPAPLVFETEVVCPGAKQWGLGGDDQAPVDQERHGKGLGSQEIGLSANRQAEHHRHGEAWGQEPDIERKRIQTGTHPPAALSVQPRHRAR
jgi:hypothetical protein